jgi:aquaporin Z
MPSLSQKLAVEFVGTAFLCFTVSCLPRVADEMVGIVVGGVLTLLVYAGGSVSGAHYNPAVTIACVVRGGLLEAKEAAAYVVVQCLAAAAGAALACGLYPFDEAAFPAPVEGVGLWTAVASEMDFTLALGYVVLMVATREETAGNSYYGLAIGLVLTSAAYCIGPVTGCAINPAVGVLALLHGSPTAWVYFVGPALGGLLAGAIFKLSDAGASYSPLVVEFFGTYYLCTAIATAVPHGSVMAPLAIGGMLAAFVYAGGPVSGGMYNPAVALAVSARNVGTSLEAALAPKTFGLYVVVQCLGALAAAADWKLASGEMYGRPSVLGHPAAADDATASAVFLAEAVGTCLLAFTVLSVATVPATKDNGYFGLAIGLAVVVAAATVGGVSGGGFNPAVSMLTLVAGDHSASDSLLTTFLVPYWVGPAAGALVGAGLFKVCHADAFPAATGTTRAGTPFHGKSS